MKLTQTCPACGHALLTEEIVTGEQSVWCGNGRCPSCTANDGTEATTIEAAVAKLNEIIEQERKDDLSDN